MTKVLVIEDNANLAFGLTRSLESEGYEVEAADDGNRGLELARTCGADLVTANEVETCAGLCKLGVCQLPRLRSVLGSVFAPFRSVVLQLPA